MTHFRVSFPGSTDSFYFEEDVSGDHQFTFVPFQNSEIVSVRFKLSSSPSENFILRKAPEELEISRDDYLKQIRGTIDHIRTNGLGKIVVSRFRDHQLKLSPSRIFQNLVEAYPEACVYLFSNPRWGTWLGATPELLILGKGAGLQSMSLAGTTSINNPSGLGEKEQAEQSMVTEFITSAYNEVGIEHTRISGPEVSRAGNLLHLKTVIEGESPGPEATQRLLAMLHPTPAVAGLPREAALAYLNEHEHYDRELYTGYFGLSTASGFRYFVNLRCMQIFENKVRLYAGGGITADSVPVNEWDETERKMATVGSHIM